MEIYGEWEAQDSLPLMSMRAIYGPQCRYWWRKEDEWVRRVKQPEIHINPLSTGESPALT